MFSTSRIVVRYAETDKMGVVYHANYLIWFEVARSDFLEMIGQPYTLLEERGLLSPVLHASCDYGTPLRYGDTAVVRTRLVELGGVRTSFYYEVFREGDEGEDAKPCCTGLTRHCLVREGSFAPVAFKKNAPELYAAYQEVVESDYHSRT